METIEPTNLSPNRQQRQPRKRRGCLWILSRFFLGLLIALLILTPLGMVYQSHALARDQKLYPSPGQRIDIGGFSLHLYCLGSGEPTVVMEAGLGDSSFIWGKVQGQIAQSTRVCAYDRPGLGWSDFVSQPFGRQQVAENLHALLQKAGLHGPYLLVGHSIGGIYIREFAYQYPHEVAGMVFVDSAHEQQSNRQEFGRMGMETTLYKLLSLCEAIAPTGVFRVFGVGRALVQNTGLPLPVQQAAASTLNRSTYCHTIANEFKTSDADTDLPNPPQSLGDIPLIALMAGRNFASEGGRPPGMSAEELSKFNAGWLGLQTELAHLSTRGKLEIVDQSGHYIHLEQPDRVIQAILEVLQDIRS